MDFTINNFVFISGDDFYFTSGDDFVFVGTPEISEETLSLIEYYQNLLITQYHDRPKSKATIGLIAFEMLANSLFLNISDAYNIDNAVGLQLDLLGKYIGLDRFYEGQSFENKFSLISYDEVDSPPSDRVGLSDYTSFETKEGSTLTYDEVINTTYKLPDEDYRFLLKLKIVLNNSDFSHKSIDDAIFKFFGLNLKASSFGNMQMEYFYNLTIDAIAKVAKQKNLLPKPMGVQLNYLIPDLGYFSLINYDEVDSPPPDRIGLSNYLDYDTKEGNTLTYSKLID